MATAWHGSVDELKELVRSLGFQGSWSGEGTSQVIFRTQTNGVLNHWPNAERRTVNFQGKNCEPFESAYEAAIQGNRIEAVSSSTKRVFVVYGHDDEARRDLELFLRRLNLDPFIMQNDAVASNTIIEVLEQEIPTHSFGIVLLTPDDFGYAKTLDGVAQTDEAKQPRARQNVILELGMLLGRLGREKVAILIKGNVERPSDLGGVLYINYNQSIVENGMQLVTKLRECGIEISDRDLRTAMSS